MSFEISDRDLMARIGTLRTKSGIIETPLLLPVVNPKIQLISPKEMMDDFGCTALFTNAYLTKQNFGEEARSRGIHNLLDFTKVIVTDSGAYQILIYGEVNTTPEDIVKFQESIDTDVAVILDVPTGWNSGRKRAEWTVNETLRRAHLTLDILTKKDILWMGPVQGGNYLDLVAYSAKEIGKMPFQAYALGSPTQVMERYLFNTLADMIMTAKKNLPVEKPLHLFGAGHPFMFSFAVALGCDMFDSAAYALYARKQKYMTNYGTAKLDELEYLPCECAVCSKYTPEELRNIPLSQREKLLALHNLYTCFAEIRRIKQSIREGRLWELLELRMRNHPSLLQALRKFMNYSDYIEMSNPISKRNGLFYFESTGLARPEIISHKKRLRDKYTPPCEATVLVLLPQPESKPFHMSRELRRFLNVLYKMPPEKTKEIHICLYAAPFGIVPIELDDVYPLSQFEIALPTDSKTEYYVVGQVEDYITHNQYKRVVLYSKRSKFGIKVENACKRACFKSGIEFISTLNEGKLWDKRSIDGLVDSISKVLPT